MQPVSDQFIPSLATAHDVLSTLTYLNPLTGLSTDLQPEDGQFTEDVAAFIRRTLTFSVPNLESLFQLTAVPGGQITVRSGIRYGTTAELVAAGTYRVDYGQIGYSQAGTLQLTCPDLSVVVQRARMGSTRTSVASNTVPQEIQRLVEGAFLNEDGTVNPYLPFPGWAQLDMSVSAQVGPQIYDSGNRDAVITQYCADNSLEFFFNANGLAVLRPVPVSGLPGLAQTLVMGPGGIMSDATRTRALTETRNVIILTTSASDVQMQAVTVPNTNDPTVDPLSSLGPLGRQVMDYQGNFRDADQAHAAGVTLLAKYCAVQQQMTVTGVGNAALEGWDQIANVLPSSDMGSRPAEYHIVQALSTPLTNKGTQQITGRSVIAA